MVPLLRSHTSKIRYASRAFCQSRRGKQEPDFVSNLG